MDELIRNVGHYIVPVLAVGAVVALVSIAVAPAVKKAASDSVTGAVSSGNTAITNAKTSGTN